MLATVSEAAEAAGRPRPTPGAFPVSFLGESQDGIAAILEEVPLLKLLLLFAYNDLCKRYEVVHPNGPDAVGYHTVPHELDPKELRELAGRLPIEMFEDFVLMGNAEEVAERLRPYADAGLEHVVLADMSSVAVGPQEAERAFAEMAKLTAMLHAM
jgi:phthiodiolone/phenolphthiodiolone dimycocerosates ketoreductase